MLNIIRYFEDIAVKTMEVCYKEDNVKAINLIIRYSSNLTLTDSQYIVFINITHQYLYMTFPGDYRNGKVLHCCPSPMH